jgi:deoxyribodipyrimidine photo-lyase
MERGIIWFRNDLRLEDNETLIRALKECDEVIPVYILDKRWLENDRWGHIRCGPIRMQFILESLEDLKTQLKKRGSDLLFCQGYPERILPELATDFKTDQIFASKAYTSEEINIEEAIRAEIPVKFCHSSTLVHPDGISFAIHKIPDVFSSFRKKIEKEYVVSPPFPKPEKILSPSLNTSEIPALETWGLTKVKKDPRAALLFQGGESHAWKRLHHYFWETGALKNYKFTRNQLIGADYSSKLSPWLAQGNISPRSIFHEIRKFEKNVKKNISTYWLFFELLWRDYFAFMAMKYGNKIFLKGGIKGKTRNYADDPQPMLEKWRSGETGDPFVDANMKELLSTGFMSNRGRQNTASYLVHDLNIDWRAGASWFESQLIDYDPCSNYGNWMYVAGIGNDPRENRKFNIRLQQQKYDPKGVYVDLWLGNNP